MKNLQKHISNIKNLIRTFCLEQLIKRIVLFKICTKQD